METDLFSAEVNPTSSDIVFIFPVAVGIPESRFLLVRKNSDYCALMFTKFWTGKTDQDYFAECYSYYQPDKLPDFSTTNIKVVKHELSWPKPRGIGRFAFSFGNMNIRCGPIDLFWVGEGWIKFFGQNQNEGDYGIELAPTKWTNLHQINVFDKRLTWYRYDPERAKMEIPINELWPEGE